MEWQHGTCDHFHCMRMHSCLILKMPLEKLAFLAKLEIRLDLNLEH